MAKLYTRLGHGFLVLHICLVSSIPVKVNRCPTDKTERETRAIKICTSIERYHCLYDTDDILVEDCIDYKQLPPGNYPIYNTFATSNPIDYKRCPRHKYQPWPAKSYEITECIAKTNCSSEGQILCMHGNVTTDISCTCDNKNGYASISKQCCHLYGTEDCSCFKKCTNNTDLHIKYSFIHINTTIAILSTEDISSKTSAYYRSRLLDYGLVFADGRTLIFVPVTALVGILCLGCCVGICILCVYEIREECKVYDEKYEIGVFRLLKAAQEGDLDELKGLAEEGFIDMADVDYDERSALHLAACEGRVAIVEYLLDYHHCNIESKDRWNRTAVQDAMWHKERVNNKENDNYETIIQLIENRKSGDTKQTEDVRDKRNIWRSAAAEMISAAENGKLLPLKRLKNKGTDMDLSDSNGRTALHAAAEKGQEKVVNYLIDICKVSPFRRCKRKRPLDLVPNDEKHKRLRLKLQTTMEEMLRKKVDDELDCPKETEIQIIRLFNCAAGGHIGRIRSFKNANYTMELRDYDQRTILHIAVSENQEHIVDYLLGECNFTNIGRTAKDRWNVTPLEAARNQAIPVVYNIFLKYYEELRDTANDDYRAFLLITAAANGDTTKLTKLHENKIDMNLMDYDRRTALHLAAAEGHLEAVKYLVDIAKVVSVSDRNNRYPEDETNNKDIQEFLKTAPKTQNTPPSEKISPTMKTMAYVMDAASKGKLHLIKDEKYKYEYFTMDSTDYYRNTPLHVAAAEAKLDDVIFLLDQKRVSPFIRNSDMKTPLDIVKRKIKYWSLKEQANCSTETQPSGEEQNPNKSQKKEFEKIKEKLETAMKLEQPEKDEYFKLHPEDVRKFLFLNKAYKGDIKAIQRYIHIDRNLVNKVDYDKRSALHLAAAEGHLDLVKFLLEQTDAHVEAPDRWNVTPLMEAMRIGDKGIIDAIQAKCGKQT